MAAKKKEVKRCEICNKTIDSIFGSYSISMLSKATICSKCGKIIDSEIFRITALHAREDRITAVRDLNKKYSENIAGDIKTVIYKKVLKSDKSYTLTVKEGGKGIVKPGLFGWLTMRQNREGKVYFDEDQDTVYEAVSYDWDGPEYEEKTRKDGSIKKKEIKTIASLDFTGMDGTAMSLRVACDSKIDQEIASFAWQSIHSGGGVDPEAEPPEEENTDSIKADENMDMEPPVGYTNSDYSAENAVYGHTEKVDAVTKIRYFVEGLDKKVKVVALASLAVLIAGIGIGSSINSHQEAKRQEEERIRQEQEAAQLLKENTEHYDKAIVLITEGKYPAACDELSGVDINDSQSILSYCNLQSDLETKYNGKAEEFGKQLDGISGIESKRVQDDMAAAKSETSEAITVQDRISKIKLEDISTYDKDLANDLEKEVSDIDDRYEILVDTSNLENAKNTLSEIESDSEIGQLILEISTLDKLEDWSTLEPKTSKLIKQYNKLSEEDKAKVVNFDTLSDANQAAAIGKKQAEDALVAMAEEQARQEEEARAAEEAAQQAAAEEAAREEERLNSTVYITRTGDKYHESYCRYGDQPITLREALSRGYEPCQICH